MATGVVKWFNNDKGYGFVLMDGEEQNEVFVHHTAIDMNGFKTLRHGQQVEFSLYYGPKGLTAQYLKPVKGAEDELLIEKGATEENTAAR